MVRRTGESLVHAFSRASSVAQCTAGISRWRDEVAARPPLPPAADEPEIGAQKRSLIQSRSVPVILRKTSLIQAIEFPGIGSREFGPEPTDPGGFERHALSRLQPEFANFPVNSLITGKSGKRLVRSGLRRAPNSLYLPGSFRCPDEGTPETARLRAIPYRVVAQLQPETAARGRADGPEQGRVSGAGNSDCNWIDGVQSKPRSLRCSLHANGN